MQLKEDMNKTDPGELQIFAKQLNLAVEVYADTILKLNLLHNKITQATKSQTQPSKNKQRS